MPLRVCTGFEFGPIATLAGLIKGDSGNKIVDAGAGTPTIVSTAPVRTGAYVLELDPAGTTEYVQWTTATLGTSQTRCTAAFAIYFPSLPTADALVAEIQVTGATPNLWFRNSDDRLYVDAAGNDPGGGTGVAGPVIQAATWYHIELYSDVSANPQTLDWWVDGTPQTQSTVATAAGTLSNVFLSGNTAQTMTCRYDDVAIWTDTSAIGQQGPHKVQLLLPDSGGTTAQIGTANATARMINNSTIEATHNSANIIAALRDVPPSGLGTTSTTGVGQRTSGSGNAVGIPMETYTLATGETISGVRVLVAGWAATATTNALGLRVFNGTTEEILFAAGNPNFDASDPCAWLCKQVAGATMFDTQTKLNGLVVRLGYSTDISPLPGAHAVYAEVAIKESSLAIAPAAVTVTATAGTVTVAGTSPEQDVTPAAVTATASPGSVALSLNVRPAAVTVTATSGSIAISGTSPAQDILPMAPTVAVAPGTVAVAQTVTPTAATATVTPGVPTVGQASTVLTESFNKADGALGPDLTWRRQVTPGTDTAQWAVVSNAAQFAAADEIVEDLHVPDDYLASVDQLVSFTVTTLADTTAGSYWISVGPQLRNEPLNAAAAYRGYAAEIGRNNQIFPGIDIWMILIWRIDTSQPAPNDVTFLTATGTALDQITLPGTLTFFVAGDQLTAWFTHAGPGPTIVASTNDSTFADGRYVGLGGGHSLVTGDTATVTIDNFRAAVVQVIEPEPVALAATPGEIASITGGADVTQLITPYADPDVILDAGDTPVPPADAVDGGTSATPLDDAFDANLNAVSVVATPGTLTVAVIETQAITPQAVTVTATPGSLAVTTGPILPTGPTVSIAAGTVTVTGGAVVAPTVNLQIEVAATRSRAQADTVSSGTRSRAAATVPGATRPRGQIEDTDATRLGYLVGATRG